MHLSFAEHQSRAAATPIIIARARQPRAHLIGYRSSVYIDARDRGLIRGPRPRACNASSLINCESAAAAGGAQPFRCGPFMRCGLPSAYTCALSHILTVSAPAYIGVRTVIVFARLIPALYRASWGAGKSITTSRCRRDATRATRVVSVTLPERRARRF